MEKTETNPRNTALVPATGQELRTLFRTNSWEEACKRADVLSRSALVPSQYQGEKGWANCMIAMEMAARTGFSPLQIMQNLYVVKGKPSWSGQFVIAALNQCGRFTAQRWDTKGDGMNRSWQAVATRLATGEELRSIEITMRMADAEGWLKKDGSKWKTMPGQMGMYRSSAFFARVHAPEILMGMYTDTESHEIDAVDAVVVEEPDSTDRWDVDEYREAAKVIHLAMGAADISLEKATELSVRLGDLRVEMGAPEGHIDDIAARLLEQIQAVYDRNT